MVGIIYCTHVATNAPCVQESEQAQAIPVRYYSCMLHPFILAGVGIASVKDSVKAALGQKAAITQGTSGLDLSAEARVQFWVRPGLKDPTVQERLQHA